MADFLKRSRIVKVEFEIALPCDATKDQIDEWVSSGCGWGGISLDNPLYQHGIDPINQPLLTDTGAHLHVSVEFVGREGTTTRYRTHRARRPEPFDGEWESDQMRRLAEEPTS